MNSNATEIAKTEKAPWAWYAGAALSLCADRVLKALALSGASYGARGVTEFTLFMNHGIAFSLPVPAAVFWPFAALALAALVYAFARSWQRSPIAAGVLFFILAGALSNLYDRAMYGATVDYLLFFGRSAVNVADGMILGGLIFLLMRSGEKDTKTAP